MVKHATQIVLAFLFGTGLAGALEPLESDPDYLKAANHRFLAKHDKNGDGTFEKDENEREWRRSKRLDKNRDGKLDAGELKQRQLRYVGSSGRQLRDVCFKRTETGKVYLDVYFPDVAVGGAKPVALYTHGGGWAAGSRHGAGNALFNTVHIALLKQGFCVVSVGYRLVKKGGETAMRDCVIDAKDALRFVSAHREALGIDPMRTYTFGDSAGGQLSQMVLLSPPENLTGAPELAKYPYKTVAGVSWYGPCDFEDEQLFNHNDRENFRDRFGPRILGPNSKPEDKLRLYREMSPVKYLTKDSPPLLMIQGDKDTTIPVKHAYHMEKRAVALDAPVEIMIIKNAGHNWRKADGITPIEPSTKAIVQRTVNFLMEHSHAK